MLHGNAPYYKGGCDIDSLDNGLNFLKSESSESEGTLLLQNYFPVAEGCEGRSHNPVAVLFDTLSRPDADLGVVKSSLLEWKMRPDLKVNHLILGKGRPGGCWEVRCPYLPHSQQTSHNLLQYRRKHWPTNISVSVIFGKEGSSKVCKNDTRRISCQE